MAIENAGFEIRDTISHIFATGFPKNHNISKQMDKNAGAERKVVGFDKSKYRANSEKNHQSGQSGNFGLKANGTGVITTATTEDAQKWEGWGTALKPAVETWILARKPIDKKTVVDNMLEYGTGGINIDASRIKSYLPGEYEKLVKRCSAPRQDISGGNFHAGAEVDMKIVDTSMSPEGRWPANLILSHSPDCIFNGYKKIKGITGSANGRSVGNCSDVYGEYKGIEGITKGQKIGYTDDEGQETVENWECADNCPIKMLNEQSGKTKSVKSKSVHEGYESDSVTGFVKGVSHPNNQYSDSGGASRFFINFDPNEYYDEFIPMLYIAKPSAKEKNAGLKQSRFTSKSGDVEKGKNTHPTVKSISLMKYLVNLITPPDGTVLDMFMGSGSTGCAAIICGFKFIGIEKDKEYCEISKNRIAYWQSNKEQS
jgi:hypothetical protein